MSFIMNDYNSVKSIFSQLTNTSQNKCSYREYDTLKH